VVDIEGVEFNSVLDSLARKVTTDDPNIKLLRAGRFKPGVVRLVMELKARSIRRFLRWSRPENTAAGWCLMSIRSIRRTR
jgi:hypothetical protein